jgi:tetratricopeptide (TPR) repeat protein
MSVFQKIEELINENRVDDAIIALDLAIKSDADNDQLYFTRGKLHWRLGNRSQAITDYEHAVAINPNSPARIALDNAHDVISFFNPDIFNP